MYNNIERRKYNRFNIPGAIVKYEEEKGFQGSEGFAGSGKLVDLTVYSVKFETVHELTPGARINIWINLDDEVNIPLRGNILWIFSENNNHPKYAAVEFIAFSEEIGFNTLESKKALERLNEKY